MCCAQAPSEVRQACCWLPCCDQSVCQLSNSFRGGEVHLSPLRCIWLRCSQQGKRKMAGAWSAGDRLRPNSAKLDLAHSTAAGGIQTATASVRSLGADCMRCLLSAQLATPASSITRILCAPNPAAFCSVNARSLLLSWPVRSSTAVSYQLARQSGCQSAA